MTKSKTTLRHTYPTGRPFKCMTGDISDQGFLVVVDKRTHELVIEEESDQTVTVAIDPRRVKVKRPRPRPGTRMLDLPASSADPMEQAGESIERLRRKLPEEES